MLILFTEYVIIDNCVNKEFHILINICVCVCCRLSHPEKKKIYKKNNVDT